MQESQPKPQTIEPACVQRSVGLPKVSLLVSDLSGQGAGRWGGAERHFLLARSLQQAGYPVEIVGFDADPQMVAATGLTVKSLPRQGMSSVVDLFKLIQGDIILAYKLKPSSFGLALLHKLFRRCPVILDIDDWEISWHGGDRYRYRLFSKQLARDLLKPGGALRQLDHPLYLKWVESLVPLADQITTHCGFLQRRFGGLYLPNGKDIHQFDPDRYDPEASRANYRLKGYRVLMFPGAPRPYKGVEDVLMALDQLQQEDLKLVVVGGSPYDDYDQYLQQRWGHHIIQLPKTPYPEMPGVIAAAHVLVVPQRDVPAAQAQFPLKLTDGMAMAKPILATRVGDIPEILADTGYLAAPESPADLAEQIELIFRDYDQALSRGRQARQRCIQQYSLETMSQTLTTLLEKLVS